MRLRRSRFAVWRAMLPNVMNHLPREREGRRITLFGLGRFLAIIDNGTRVWYAWIPLVPWALVDPVKKGWILSSEMCFFSS